MQPISQPAPDAGDSSAVALPSLTPRSAHVPLERERRARWPLYVGLGLLALLIIGAGTAFGVYQTWRGSKMLAPGLMIQGESVGGLEAKTARANLQKRFGRLFITVKTPDRPFKMSLSELGAKPKIEGTLAKAYGVGRAGSTLQNVWNYWTAHETTRRFALPVGWNKTQLKRKMSIVARQYRREPRNARLTVSGAGVQVVPHQTGRALNLGATLFNLQKKYYVGLPALMATIKTVQPRLTAADLAGTDLKIGSYTTRFNSGLWGRTRNIHVASAAIDGRVLMPGELLSFNACTGERLWNKGYRMAHIFETKPGASQAEVVDGLAGGTCQVSSTLYNAVRKTNQKTDDGLKIVERNSHSLPVTYVPRGLDATVAWPYKDFKFRNALPHPVYLRTQIAGSRLTISVWGRVPQA